MIHDGADRWHRIKTIAELGEATVAISAGLNGTGLVVLAFPPGTSGAGNLVVTLGGGYEHTWCGRRFVEDSAEEYGRVLNPDIGRVIGSSWALQVIDPRWGRNDVLWRSLLLALTEF